MKNIFHIFLAIVLSFSALLISSDKVFATVQDLTSYTEVDPNSRIAVTANRVTATNLTRNEDAYVYKDMGIDYFAGSFRIDFQVQASSGNGGTAIYNVATLANTVDDWQGLDNANASGLAVTWSTGLSGSVGTFAIQELDSGTLYADSSSIARNYGTTYYMSLVRDETEDIYGMLWLGIYSDIARENLLEEFVIILHSSKKDYRYFYALQSINTGSGTSGSAYSEAYNITLYSGNDIVPFVVTYDATNQASGILLTGASVSEDDNITEQGFDFGNSVGNYTSYLSANQTEGSAQEMIFTYLLSSDNMTMGNTYYFRASTENSIGVGYGAEKSFVWLPDVITLTLSDAVLLRYATGNYTATFTLAILPANRVAETSNTTIVLASDSNFENEINIYSLYGYDNNFVFITGQGALLPNTTYYYYGQTWWGGLPFTSSVRWFTTGAGLFETVLTKPSVSITQIRNVSRAQNADYAYEVTASISANSTTDQPLSYGIMLSLNRSDSVLLPIIYTYYGTNISPNLVYSMVFLLDNTSWYTGQILHFQAFIDTTLYNKVLSSVVTYTPSTSDVDIISDTSTSSIVVFADLFNSVRSKLGMTGILGSWAFLLLILVIIALLFGSALVSAKDDVVKRVVAIIWAIISLAVIGGFVFSGQLGILAILVLVGSAVLVILVIAGLKLSGGNT